MRPSLIVLDSEQWDPRRRTLTWHKQISHTRPLPRSP